MLRAHHGRTRSAQEYARCCARSRTRRSARDARRSRQLRDHSVRRGGAGATTSASTRHRSRLALARVGAARHLLDVLPVDSPLEVLDAVAAGEPTICERFRDARQATVVSVAAHSDQENVDPSVPEFGAQCAQALYDAGRRSHRRRIDCASAPATRQAPGAARAHAPPPRRPSPVVRPTDVSHGAPLRLPQPTHHAAVWDRCRGAGHRRYAVCVTRLPGGLSGCLRLLMALTAIAAVSSSLPSSGAACCWRRRATRAPARRSAQSSAAAVPRPIPGCGRCRPSYPRRPP
jgi:hypothetical protein